MTATYIYMMIILINFCNIANLSSICNYIISTHTATEAFCSPDFIVEFLGLKFPVTQANGMCSYGVCNVGYYNSTFEKKDIADQCFNPAGQFDYDQLINQAKNQTYVITELFSTTEIPKSVFSVYLPKETFPTTKFLYAPAPSKPTIIPSTTCMATTSSISMPITTPPVTSAILPTTSSILPTTSPIPLTTSTYLNICIYKVIENMHVLCSTYDYI